MCPGALVSQPPPSTQLTLGALTNNNAFTKQGAGILVLGTASVRNSTSTINDGMVRLAFSTGFGSGGAVNVNAGTLEIANVAMAANDLTLNNGATLLGTGTGASYSRSNFPSIGNAADVTLRTGAAADVLTISSAIRNGDSASVINVSGPGTVVVASGATAATAYAGSWNLDGTSTTVLRLTDGNALGNPGSTGGRPITLTNGTLQLRVSGDTTFSAATTVSGNVTITPERGAAGTSITDTMGTLTVSDGLAGVNTLTLTVTHGTNFNANNTGSLSFGAVTLADHVSFVLNNTNGSATGVTTLGAIDDGGVAKTVSKSGNGALTLSAAATSLVNGTIVNITGGTVNSNNGTALGSLANVTLSTGATLNAGATQTLGALNSAASNTGAVTIGANTLTVGNTNNLASNFAGVISGTNGNLIKGGSGRLTLSGTNTYSGSTAVNNGSLTINGALNAGGGLVTVSATTPNTATLAGIGSVNRSVTIADRGQISPGAGGFSLSNFNINQASTTTTFAPSGTYVWQTNSLPASGTAGTNWDKLTLNALSVTATAGTKFTVKVVSVNAGGTAIANVTGISGVPNTQYTWTIATSASFSGFDITKFALDTSQFNNDSAGEWSLSVNGNNLDLTLSVPEPSSAVLMGASVIGLMRRRRRSALLNPLHS
ncbi:hypothetical protein BH09PLA1_BH09PLA1_34120 [soil metagenome]